MSSATPAGFGLQFRRVTLEDAPLLLALRRSPVAAPFISYTPPALDNQRAWIAKQLERQGDHYFVVCDEAGRTLGTISVYDIADGTAEWGRFIMPDASAATLGSVLNLLAYSFEVLGLETLCSWTMAANTKVVALHDRLGYPFTTAYRSVEREHGSQRVEFRRHQVTQAMWPQIKAKWTPVAAKLTRFVVASAS